MDDSGMSSQDMGYSDLPEYVEVYYQFKDGLRELKAITEELRGLEKRKLKDAFGFNRGLEKRLKGLNEQSSKLSKSKTQVDNLKSQYKLMIRSVEIHRESGDPWERVHLTTFEKVLRVGTPEDEDELLKLPTEEPTPSVFKA
jgi:hypothetical protein